MADVDRGQLLLLTAIGMAVLFVALALILNTAIYTENLAARSSELGGGGEAVRYADSARRGIGGAIAYANENNETNHETLQRNLSGATAEWDDAVTRQFGHRAGAATLSLAATTNGTRIEQESVADFTDDDGNTSWTLAGDVDHTREFRINVTSADLLVLFGALNEFNLTVDDGSSTWRMNVTKNLADEVIVSGETGAGNSFNCTPTSPPVWINVTAGTVGGDDCDGFGFADGVGTSYNLTYKGADNVEGTYTLIVDNETLAASPSPHLHDDDAGSDPFAAPAIYAANVTAVYRTPDLYYNTTLRVAPGESDD